MGLATHFLATKKLKWTNYRFNAIQNFKISKNCDIILVSGKLVILQSVSSFYVDNKHDNDSKLPCVLLFEKFDSQNSETIMPSQRTLVLDP